jgi:hypothetical protein
VDQVDRKTLLQCSELVVKQAARLREYEKLTEIASIEAQADYISQVRQSQPHLDHIRILVQAPSTDQDAFDTLRKLLESVTSPSPSK